MMNRRSFLQTLGWAGAVGSASVLLPTSAKAEESSGVSFSGLRWSAVEKGLDFCRIEITRGSEKVDAIAVLRINPAHNRMRVFHGFDYARTVVRTIEEWQQETSALAMINGAQYMADPYYMPCALVICDGKIKGPRGNKQVRGMFVAEPTTSAPPRADVLDFEYDRFNHETTPYTQGVQHWPILLDRKGKIKVAPSELRANRSVIARDSGGNILFFSTEGGFFTLYGFGLFLKECNARKDGGFQVHTAMNLDGGDEAQLIVKSDSFTYLPTRFENGAPREPGLFDWKIRLPGVIGVFPRT